MQRSPPSHVGRLRRRSYQKTRPIISAKAPDRSHRPSMIAAITTPTIGMAYRATARFINAQVSSEVYAASGAARARAGAQESLARLAARARLGRLGGSSQTASETG